MIELARRIFDFFCFFFKFWPRKTPFRHLRFSRDVTRYKAFYKIQGVCIWFNINFSSRLILSTHPKSPATHWKQCVIFFDEDMFFDEKEIELEVKYKQQFKRKKDRKKRLIVNHRFLRKIGSVEIAVSQNTFIVYFYYWEKNILIFSASIDIRLLL